MINRQKEQSVSSLRFAVLAALVCQSLSALAQDAVPFVVHESKRRSLTPADAQLDTSTPLFTIQETRKRAAKSAGPGIVGIDMLISGGRYPVVQMVFPGTPAWDQGLQAGDTIVAVDGVQTVGKTRSQIDIMISDRPGDVVVFTVARATELKQITVTVASPADLPRNADDHFRPN